MTQVDEHPVVADSAERALDALESESIHIFREVAGEFDRPVILFSGGKDSTLLLHLAIKAFWPAPVPFPLLHVDTGHNFAEVIEFRDRMVEQHDLRLIVANVQDWIDDGRLPNARTASATRCRPCRCWTPSTSTGSTRCSAVGEGTRRGPAPRSAYSVFVTPSGNGSLGGSARSCGTCITVGTKPASTYGCSLSLIGLNWTYGGTSSASASNYRQFISVTDALFTSATECC